MLATRHDQENAVGARQRVGMSKEDGVKAQTIKPPTERYPKTPQRQTRHDENAATVRADGKGKQEIRLPITPAGHRTRAPLVAKTTNAKATAFLTPARINDQDLLTKRTASPRARRPKFKVHEADKAVVEEYVFEDREIEYMPPRGEPLPDLPGEDLWPHNPTFPQFEGANFTQGWAAEFCRSDASDDEAHARRLANVRKREHPPTQRDHGPSSIRSRDAAGMLGKPELNHFAAATSASKARSKQGPRTKDDITATNARHIVNKATSNTTLGYSKGRNVLAARKPVTSTSEAKQDGPKSLRNLWISSDDREFDARVEAFEQAEIEEMENDFFACSLDTDTS